MKIAILTPTYSPFSGIDRVVESEAEEYCKAGDDVTIFALSAEMKPQSAKLEVIGMPKNPAVARLYRLLFFLDIPKLVKYVKMLKGFDLVISHFYPMNVLASLSKNENKTKYLYYDAGIAYPRLFPSLAERVYMHMFWYFNKLTVRNADSAISISQFLSDELKKETGIQSKVVYVEIDRKRFNEHIDHEGIERIKKLHNLTGPVCLYVGRISPHKGIHLLIKAFNKVLEEIPTAQLVIVGKPTFDSYSKELNKLAAKNVIFAGFVKDEELPYYYGACTVYATGSLWEGFDMPVVEAQGCGKPVVAFDCCSHPEVVKNGLLVKPEDISGFALALERYLK